MDVSSIFEVMNSWLLNHRLPVFVALSMCQ